MVDIVRGLTLLDTDFPSVINKASVKTAPIIREFPKREFILLDPPLITFINNTPMTASIIPIIFLGVNLSFKNTKEIIPIIAGRVLVITPASIAVVNFNPYNIKILNKNTPVRACRKRMSNTFGLIAAMRFSRHNNKGIKIRVAIINLNSEAKNIGKLDRISLPATTELPTIAIAKDIFM